MSLPTIQVRVAFQTTVSFGTPFQLDNPTYGELNDDTLGGFQWVDVTAKAQAITITRGRNRQTEQFNAGTCSVAFRDPNRELDPLNTASIYYPYVGPRQPIEVYANGIQIFSGVITDWNRDYDYTLEGDVVTAQASDQFTVLANMTMNQWMPAAESSGDRIQTVLELPEIEYQGPYAIDGGQSTLGAYQVNAGTNVLTYLQTVTTSEAGWLFMSANGVLTFLDRHTTLNPTATVEFSDNGTDVPYRTLENQFGDELLYNYIQMQSPAGAVQTAADTDSIALYQAQQYSKLDLLNSTTGEVQDLADAFLGAHKDPLLRFTAIEVQLAALAPAHQEDVLSAELVDVVSVEKSFATGLPSSVTQTVVVSGVSHTISPGSHTMKFTFENIDQRAFLTLDGPVLGKLDFNRLAF
jgi:hypothetical protein